MNQAQKSKIRTVVMNRDFEEIQHRHKDNPTKKLKELRKLKARLNDEIESIEKILKH